MKLLYYLADGAALVAICYLSVVASLFAADFLQNIGVLGDFGLLGFTVMFFLSGGIMAWLWYRFSPISSRKIRQGRND